MVKKLWKIRLLVLTEFTNVTDRQTDGRTAHDGIGRACTASRGKNELVYFCVFKTSTFLLLIFSIITY